jgi:hypothetical protein
MNVCLDCSFTDLLNLMANFVIIIFLVKQVLKTFLVVLLIFQKSQVS